MENKLHLRWFTIAISYLQCIIKWCGCLKNDLIALKLQHTEQMNVNCSYLVMSDTGDWNRWRFHEWVQFCGQILGIIKVKGQLFTLWRAAMHCGKPLNHACVVCPPNLHRVPVQLFVLLCIWMIFPLLAKKFHIINND